MKRALILFVLFPFTAQCQFFLPSIEPVFGINYYKESLPKNEEMDWLNDKGLILYYGMRGNCMFGNKMAVSIGTGIKQYPDQLDLFLSATLKAYLWRNYQTGFSLFCEAGGEVSGWGGLTLPLYLGTNQYMGDCLSFNFRVRIPTILDVKYIESINQMELGLEAGLQFDLHERKNKKRTRTGSPFILR